MVVGDEASVFSLREDLVLRCSHGLNGTLYSCAGHRYGQLHAVGVITGYCLGIMMLGAECQSGVAAVALDA